MLVSLSLRCGCDSQLCWSLPSAGTGDGCPRGGFAHKEHGLGTETGPKLLFMHKHQAFCHRGRPWVSFPLEPPSGAYTRGHPWGLSSCTVRAQAQHWRRRQLPGH